MSYQTLVIYRWLVFIKPESEDLRRCEIDHAEAYSTLGVEDKNITRSNLILQSDDSIIYTMKKWLTSINPDFSKKTLKFINNDYSTIDAVFLSPVRGSLFKSISYIVEFILSACFLGVLGLIGAAVLFDYLTEGVVFFDEKRKLEHELYEIRKAENTLANPYTPMPWIQIYTDFHEEFKWKLNKEWYPVSRPKKYKNMKKRKNRIIFWWDAWSFANTRTSLENISDTSWNMYKKYRLSIWANWHVLEERIVLFLIIFYFMLL